MSLKNWGQAGLHCVVARMPIYSMRRANIGAPLMNDVWSTKKAGKNKKNCLADTGDRVLIDYSCIVSLQVGCLVNWTGAWEYSRPTTSNQ